MPGLSPDLPNLSRILALLDPAPRGIKAGNLATISILLEYQTGERRRPANPMRFKIIDGARNETPRLDGGVRTFLRPKLAILVGGRLLPKGFLRCPAPS
jgi:hypothetical protein